MRKYKVFTVILVMFMMACATLNTPLKRSYTARVQFNDLVEEYLKHQSQVDPATRHKINIAIKDVDFALDTWDKHVKDPNYDYSTDMELWLKLKTEIIKVLTEVSR